MNLVVRRRLAVGVVATATAIVASVLVAPSAIAGNVNSVNPSFAFNDDDSEQLTFSTQSSFTPDPLGGGSVTVTLTRVGTNDSFSRSNDSFTDPKAPKATFNFRDTGSNDNDGPANPGSYNVTVEDSFNGSKDTCQGCFQVFTAGLLRIDSATPRALAAGGSDNITFAGSGFARGTKLDFLLPNTSTVDSAITVGPPTMAGSFTQCGPSPCQVRNPNQTTNTTLARRISIAAADTAGLRDIRVTNVDGTTATCFGCFTVNGAPLSSVTPNAVDNAPSSTNTVRITFSGAAVPQSGTPFLVFTGNPGSATKDALTLEGSNASFSSTSVSADFTFASAAPGVNAYTPTLVQSDGSTNTCSCQFSVGQGSPPTVKSLDPPSASPSDSRTVTITGTGFSRGVRITFSGTGIDVTSVQFVSPTEVRASIKLQPNAAVGKRDVNAFTTSGPTGSDTTYPKSGPPCVGCFTVTAAASGSPSATPTSTVSPSPRGCPSAAVTTRVNTKTINATGLASVTVTGATPSATIELQGYSQDHFGTVTFANDPTPIDRVGQADANGSITFNDLRPASNTRLRARQQGCTFGNSAVIEVRAQETLVVKRTGLRSYTFSGRSIPARPGGLIVSLYRIIGSACAAGVEPSRCPGEKFIGQARAVSLGRPGEGLYSIRIVFPARDQNVRDEFVVKTGRDAQNAPGRSNVRSLLIN